MTQLRVEIDKKLHQRLLMEAVKQETVLKELVPRLLNKALEDDGCRHPNDGKQQGAAQSEGSSESSTTASGTPSDRPIKASEVIQL